MMKLATNRWKTVLLIVSGLAVSQEVVTGVWRYVAMQFEIEREVVIRHGSHYL